MNAFSATKEELLQVTPRQIRALLRMKKWSGSASDPIWTKSQDGEALFVMVPISSEFRDYGLVLGELLRTLAIAETSSLEAIWRELKESSFDVQEIRLLPNTASGTIPIEEASEAFSAVEELLAATATSLVAPGPVLPRRPSETSRFMKQVLAGPTREGSYVLTLMTPIPPALTTEEDQVLFAIQDTPFERAVTLRMLESLSALKSAASTPMEVDDDTDAFASTIEKGVSANLCEAIVRLSSGGALDFEVFFNWALDRPVVTDVKSISIGKELIPAIQSAANMFRLLTSQPRIDLTGTVTRLHRESQSGHGDITIAGTFLLDEIARSVKATVSLAQSDYESAITAHQDRKTVTIQGTLVRRGTRSYLEDSALFRIVD